jgi:hypothetical protein
MSYISKLRVATVLIAGVTTLGISAVYADDYNGKYKYDQSHFRKDSLKGCIMHDDRDVIRDYMTSHRKICPAGQVKKGNGCLHPDQARNYRVGQILPDDVMFQALPNELLVQLSPLPAGYAYVKVDKDVLLISEANKKVIDAVTLMSALRE